MGFGSVARMEAELPAAEYFERIALANVESDEAEAERRRQRK